MVFKTIHTKYVIPSLFQQPTSLALLLHMCFCRSMNSSYCLRNVLFCCCCRYLYSFFTSGSLFLKVIIAHLCWFYSISILTFWVSFASREISDVISFYCSVFGCHTPKVASATDVAASFSVNQNFFMVYL